MFTIKTPAVAAMPANTPDHDQKTAKHKKSQGVIHAARKMVLTVASETKRFVSKRTSAFIRTIKPETTEQKFILIARPSFADINVVTPRPIEETSAFVTRKTIQALAVAFVKSEETAFTEATIAKETKVFANTWLRIFTHHYNSGQSIGNPTIHFEAALAKTTQDMIALKEAAPGSGAKLFTELTQTVARQLKDMLILRPTPQPRTLFATPSLERSSDMTPVPQPRTSLQKRLPA